VCAVVYWLRAVHFACVAATLQKLSAQLNALKVPLAELTLLSSCAVSTHSKLEAFLTNLDVISTDHLLTDATFEREVGDLVAQLGSMIQAAGTGDALFFASSW
jgi:hypothetical protein